MRLRRVSKRRRALRCAIAMTDPWGLTTVGPGKSEESLTYSPSIPWILPKESVTDLDSFWPIGQVEKRCSVERLARFAGNSSGILFKSAGEHRTGAPVIEG